MFLGIRGVCENGVMACGMKAEYYLSAGWPFDTQALRADGHATVGPDFNSDPQAPDISPPRGNWGRSAGPFSFLAVSQARWGVWLSSRWISLALRRWRKRPRSQAFRRPSLRSASSKPVEFLWQKTRKKVLAVWMRNLALVGEDRF